jgi:hypothetical protein
MNFWKHRYLETVLKIGVIIGLPVVHGRICESLYGEAHR